MKKVLLVVATGFLAWLSLTAGEFSPIILFLYGSVAIGTYKLFSWMFNSLKAKLCHTP